MNVCSVLLSKSEKMGGNNLPAGLCCFSGRTRYLILLLTTISISTLFANLILFNLTSILHTELGENEKPVPNLLSLNSYVLSSENENKENRKKRDINDVKKRKDDYWKEEGHPILYSTTTTSPSTTKPKLTTIRSTKPKTFYITNSPALKNVETQITEDQEEDQLKKEYEKALRHLNVGENKKIEQETTGESKKFEEKIEKKESTLISKLKKTILYAAPGVGVIVGLFIINSITTSLKTRIIFPIILALSGLTSIITPSLINNAFAGLLPIRILQGCLFSSVFPVMGKVLTKWGTVKEQLLFISTLLSFLAFGPLFSWPITMFLYIINVQLNYVYISHGILLLILALIWLIIYRDQPCDHVWVSGSESRQISVGKAKEVETNRSRNEFNRVLLRSYSVWSIWFSFCGTFTTIAFFSIYLPSFLSSQDVFLVDFLGIYSALPFFFIPVFCGVSYSALNIGYASTKTVRLWNGIGLGLAATLVFSLPIITHFKNENLTLFFLLFPLASLGVSIVGGFGHSLTIVGRVYAEKIFSMAGYSFGIAFVLIPIVTNSVITENKNSEWWNVTTFVAIFLVGATIEFAFFGRGRCSSWAESSWDPLASSLKMNTLSLIEPSQDERGLMELQPIKT